MPGLLSGSTLRRGGSATFIDLKGAQPQLPPSPTTSTGYTIVTNEKLVTTYRSSLGNIQFTSGTMYSNVPNQNIQLVGTGTSTVIVAGNVINTSTFTGVLVVHGGVGIQDGLWAGKDIHVSGITVGQGFQGKNNVVMQGLNAVAQDDSPTGQASIAIGWDTLLGIGTSLKVVAIGRNVIGTGTGVIQTISIGDGSLRKIGVYHSIPWANITGVSTSGFITVTASGHNITSGTEILITGVVGTTELNNNTYYADPVTPNDINLYTDINLTTPLTGTFTAYDSGGLISITTVYDDNIAVGVNAANNLINGRQNFFLGHNLATSLTTGSYNLLIGHEVANNMTKGSGNIALGGDNLVDGVDNQISIGSTFYYNGGGYLQINADTGLGLGTLSTGTSSGALVVLGGVGIGQNLNVGGITRIISTEPATLQGDGALRVTGGASIGQNFWVYQDATIGRDLNVIRELNVTGQGAVTLSPASADVLIEPTLGGSVTIRPSIDGVVDKVVIGQLNPRDGYFTNLYVNTNVTATTFYGNLVGVATTATNIRGGNRGSLPYQTTSGVTTLLPIGSIDQVLVSDGHTPQWSSIGALSAGTAQTATNSNNVFINAVSPLQSYYLGLTDTIVDYSPVRSDVALTYATESTSSYFTSGTNTLNVPGNIYSNAGNADEDYLLYTPRVTVAIQAPTTSTNRVGDYWIDLTSLAQYQWINDGGNRFWLQIAQL
jgi:hypothetical protein